MSEYILIIFIDIVFALVIALPRGIGRPVCNSYDWACRYMIRR